METEKMVGTIRKVISFVTLVTSLVIAVRELKVAIDGIRKMGRSNNSTDKVASQA